MCETIAQQPHLFSYFVSANIPGHGILCDGQSSE